MIRFILVCIVVIAYLVLTIPVLLVEWIIGKFSPMTKDISSLRMVQAIFKFILWITGAKVTVIGEENVPKALAVLRSPFFQAIREHRQKKKEAKSKAERERIGKWEPERMENGETLIA